MGFPCRKLEGFLLVLIVLVSSYLTIVQIVNALNRISKPLLNHRACNRSSIILQPRNNRLVAYRASVCFEGDSVCNVTAFDLVPNGSAHLLTTNDTGCATLHLSLQRGDSLANACRFPATFNGTNPRKANLTAKDPYGSEYTVCTTVQYDLRLSSNSSSLAVLLQSAEAMKTRALARAKGI
jgi:hypothetical protein